MSLGVFLTFVLAGAPVAPADQAEERFERLGAYAAELMKEHGVPGVALGVYAKDRLIVTEGPQKGGRAEIIRKPDGSIGWLRFGGRIHPRVR